MLMINPLNFRLRVPVVFHVIHNGAAGRVSRARLDAQIETLNRGFAGLDASQGMCFWPSARELWLGTPNLGLGSQSL